ncbi:MAG TPA: tol-pal system protein YbgF [Pseudomonadales bacterium]|nr:tol-pal system protein YbgF [Pseudomonadales bacterium]
MDSAPSFEQDAAGPAPRAARAAAGSASYRPPSFDGAPAPAATAGSSASGDVPANAAGVLYAQLQDLQQEVMMLRGVVEAQQKAIERMEREQRERYLDLDRRLARGVGAGSSGAGASPAAGAASEAFGASASGSPDERGAYDAAFALTREKRFEEAIPAFRSLIADYPGGQYVPNSWYWLGELYLALPEPKLEQARQAFVQVAEQFPQNRKAPDALFKLGIVHDRLGEKDRARQYLDRVRAEYPGSEAARLADTYIRQQL